MREAHGIWRGVVEDTADPEQRKRYRVRVANLHRPELPKESLPWAELCVFAGKGFGDVPHFEVGDPVFVMFQGSDARFPVLMGGWISYQGGTNAITAEQTGDYPSEQQRWIRADRAGNKMVMSPIPDEAGFEFQSGDVTLRLRGYDGTFEVETTGRAIVRASWVQVLDADDVTVESARLFANVSESAVVRSDGDVSVRAASTINIGTYTSPDPLAPPDQTASINIEATSSLRLVSGGTYELDVASNYDIDAVGPVRVHSDADLLIEGGASVSVTSDGPVSVSSPSVSIAAHTEGVEVTAQTDITLDAAQDVMLRAARNVTIQAEGGDVAITVAGDVSIDALGDADIAIAGSARVAATGLLSMSSASKLEIDAPVIEMTASSLLTLTSADTLRLVYAVGLIGS